MTYKMSRSILNNVFTVVERSIMIHSMPKQARAKRSFAARTRQKRYALFARMRAPTRLHVLPKEYRDTIQTGTKHLKQRIYCRYAFYFDQRDAYTSTFKRFRAARLRQKRCALFACMRAPTRLHVQPKEYLDTT